MGHKAWEKETTYTATFYQDIVPNVSLGSQKVIVLEIP